MADIRDPNHVPTPTEALADPAGFVAGMTETRATHTAHPTPAMHAEFVAVMLRLIDGGDWRTPVAMLRQWYRLCCPRFARDEVELGLHAIGTIWGYRRSALGHVGQPARDWLPNFITTPHDAIYTREQAEIQWRRDATNLLTEIPGYYARVQARIDATPDAEIKVAEHIARIEAQRIG